MLTALTKFAASLMIALSVPYILRYFGNTSSHLTMTTAKPWASVLDSLPSTPHLIPSFFFSHGSPVLAMPSSNGNATSGPRSGLMSYQGADGPLASFLKDFGPALLKKYQPKGIVVFSAHWESPQRLGKSSHPVLFSY